MKPIRLFGVDFPNAVGLAAGFDKNAEVWRAGRALGFGHVEVGTVTGQGQPGNPKPRLFRYPRHAALVNRMGFNNGGCEAVAARLRSQGAHRRRPGVLGINIGKTKAVPLEEAAADYRKSFHALADFADYMAINVSSPNTPELRRLQGSDFLPDLLGTLREANEARAKKLGCARVPLLLKIAPDLSFREIDQILEIVEACGIDGLIATNTTVARPLGLAHEVEKEGGLSGRPLHRRAVDVVDYISRATDRKLPLIGVGGVEDPVTACRMLDNGAHLVQLYSAMVFEGPFLGREIARACRAYQERFI